MIGMIKEGVWWQGNNYIFVGDMSAAGAKTKRIGKYHFRLTGRDNLYFKGEQVVAFTPLPKNKLIKNRSIIPKFNHDRKFYTYAFHLPSSTPENDQHLLEEHQKRAAESLLELSELLVPKPRSRHKYCGVCRGHYEDYKDHIESEAHVNHLRTSRYQELINQVCSQYQHTQEKKEADEVKVIDLTTEEGSFKPVSELVETMSASKPTLS